VPRKVKDDLKLIPVVHMDQVLQVALHPPVEKPARQKRAKRQVEEAEASEAEVENKETN
jgi:ATP-dependent Lon protease